MFRNFSHTDLSVLETYSNTVAPHAGAWIETSIKRADWLSMDCRTPCGCVD